MSVTSAEDPAAVISPLDVMNGGLGYCQVSHGIEKGEFCLKKEFFTTSNWTSAV